MHSIMRFLLILAMAVVAIHGGDVGPTDPQPTDPVETTMDSGGGGTSTAPAPTPVVTTPAPVLASPQPTTTPPTMATEPPTPASPQPTTTPPTMATEPPTPATPEPTTTPPTMATEPPTPATPEPTTTPPTMATVPPSAAPSAAPTTEPPVETDAPTVMPTTEPPVETIVPTVVPTTEAPAPSAAPTGVTEAPTVAPTKAPATTEAPTQMSSQVPAQNFPNLSQTMVGVSPLDDDSWKTYEEVYKNFYKAFYAANDQFGVSNVDIVLQLVSQDPPARRRLGGGGAAAGQRQLQDTLSVVFNQAIAYSIVPGSGITSADVVTQPFASQTARDAFATMLRGSGDPAFANIRSVSGVTQSNPPSDGGGGGLSTGAIIGIAVGGAAGLALLAGGGYWLYKRNHSGGYAKDVGDQPPSSLNLGGGDDVSTLQDPTRDNKMSTYGDQSVATVDYDYSKAYGGGGDTSVVSSVGGTLGSQTANTAPGAGAVDASFSDDASFEAHYRDPNASVKEVALEVWAPPGKLGVVIDTPNDGAPVVHAIKDSSPIADKLQVGDKLIAVDDENVETMTAIKVSKLISRKSANSTRKLSIVRTVVDE